MDFSIVITNYNYGGFVAEAVESALQQTKMPKEIIVIDDGSTDGSREILTNRFGSDPRVRLHFQANAGQLAAIAQGARLATGDVICALDADDTYAAGYLHALDTLYTQQPEVSFVYCNLRFFGNQEGTLFDPGLRSRVIGLTVLATRFALKWNCSATSAISMRRLLFLRAVDVPQDLLDLCRYWGDWGLNLGGSILGGFKYVIAEPLVNYRVHKNNNTMGAHFGHVRTTQHEFSRWNMAVYYGSRIRLGRDQLRLAKSEFKTRASPTFREALEYIGYLWQAPLNIPIKLERSFSILRHFVRARRR